MRLLHVFFQLNCSFNLLLQTKHYLIVLLFAPDYGSTIGLLTGLLHVKDNYF